MSDIVPFLVKRCTPSDLTAFGVKVLPVDCEPSFEVQDGIVWKRAGTMYVYDDGRVKVIYHSHLTARELEVVYGLAERCFKGGRRLCQKEGWPRKRKSKNVRYPFYYERFMVRADKDDPYAQVVAESAGITKTPEDVKLDSVADQPTVDA